MRFVVILCLGLAGCAQFPDLGEAPSPGAAYPALIPLDGLQGIPAQNRAVAEQAQTNVSGRLAALRGKARRLQRPVIDRRTRARMRAGVQTR